MTLPPILTVDQAAQPTAGVILTPAELHALTGYRHPRAQLAELHRQGFWRARRSPAGQVILERAHYDAVARGATADGARRPQVKPPQLRRPAVA